MIAQQDPVTSASVLRRPQTFPESFHHLNLTHGAYGNVQWIHFAPLIVTVGV